MVSRIGKHTGGVAVVQHTMWKYCNRIMQHGTTVLFDKEGVASVGVVERLFEVAGLFVVTYRQFESKLVHHDQRCVLPSLSLHPNEHAMEMNTSKLAVAHRCIVGGRCYVLHY